MRNIVEGVGDCRAMEEPGESTQNAVACLGQARRAAVDPELDFLFGLALLRGRRPHRVRSNRELSAARDCLRRVVLLPHARLLLLLIDEDRGQGWRRGGPVSGVVPALAAAADPGQVQRILDHVSAHENRVWQFLAENQGRETGR